MLGNKLEYYPFQLDFLPQEFLQKAEEELNETVLKSKKELEKLKELLSANKTTADIDFQNDFLKLFLRYTKYNSSKAFWHIQNFANFRRNYNNLFMSIPEENFSTIPFTKMLSILPYRSPDGCPIIVTEIGKCNPDELSIEDFKRMAIFLYLQPLRCPGTQISGFKVIHDFKNVSIKYLKFCTPQNLYLFYNVALNCVPARYKETHCINESVILKVVWSVVKRFLSAKMSKRVFIHSKPEDLLNYFPPSLLPSKYGGSLENYHSEDLMLKLNKEHGNYPVGGQPNYF